jgi:hypothetical protein
MYRIRFASNNHYRLLTTVKRYRHSKDIEEVETSTEDLSKSYWKATKRSTAQKLVDEINAHIEENERPNWKAEIEEF